MKLALTITLSLFSVLAWSDPPTFTRPYVIPRDEYKETRDLTTEMMKQFPPDKYHYVFVGRSPVTLAAFTHSLDPSLMTNLPGSGFSFVHRLYQDYEGKPDRMFDLFNGKINEHFKRFLPSAREVEGKKILVVDYAREGESLAGFEGAIKRYYGKDVAVEALALTDPTKSEGSALATKKGYHQISLRPYPTLRRGFETGQYEEIAEYPEEFHVMRQKSSDLKKGAFYSRVVEAYTKQILFDNDPKLRALVHELPHVFCIRSLGSLN